MTDTATKKRRFTQSTIGAKQRKRVESPVKLGRVKVAKYYPGKPMPKSPGYRNILIHTSATRLGGDLSPYILKDEHGRILENVWQFSKIYERVTVQRTRLSRFHPNKIIWQHGSEQHIGDNKTILPAYWDWRRKGMANEFAVRYPNGFHGRTKCVSCLWRVDGKLEWLDYISARKHVYCGEYIRLAPHTKHFSELKKLLESGVNLQIVEVDGPDPNLDFGPYAKLSKDNPGLEIDEGVIRQLIDDPRKPFGHGYVIAALLLGGSEWMMP